MDGTGEGSGVGVAGIGGLAVAIGVGLGVVAGSATIVAGAGVGVPVEGPQPTADSPQNNRRMEKKQRFMDNYYSQSGLPVSRLVNTHPVNQYWLWQSAEVLAKTTRASYSL